LAEQIRRRGGSHPPLTTLRMFLETTMDRWSQLIPRFQQQIAAYDDRLGVAARDRTLLHIPADVTLSRRTARVVHDFARHLFIPWDDIVAAWPTENQRGAEQWRGLLSVDRARLGQNTEFRRLFQSPLASAPLIDSDVGVLLALPHVLSTDLSRLVERLFAQQSGLRYYRARGETLEKAAVRDLARIFTGGRSLHGGKYTGERPGELIEVDGVIVWEDIALVVESKGGYLSLRARHGDVKAATSDLRKTIGDGFFQAARFVRKLVRDNRVELVNDEGEKLVVDAAKVRRVYTVIPTADTFGSITIDLEGFWRKGIIPESAFPLVIATQDMRLLADVLPTPLEFLAYLDYREEILAHSTIYLADEMEILGNFVGGIDIINQVELEQSAYSFQFTRPEWRRRTHIVAMSTDAQEKYLNPWIEISGAAWQRGDLAACPPPPRRHNSADRKQIERFAGDDDPIIPLANAKLMARLLRHGTVHIIRGGGHLALLTHAGELVPLIHDFVTAPDRMSSECGSRPSDQLWASPPAHG
jgi:pimeloyl-ACP methyl ester carboxylesterase